eukprot:TRINITY_DN1822_c1_g4_i1.p1 TRINITY_DN1822_c1_g4~~TRINITY_DN1822_c1_g4_i1.p1  ORF type:complete len:284 (-),score=53.44 TRINITY_DN1822_c1_g4_i1:24-875(-)
MAVGVDSGDGACGGARASSVAVCTEVFAGASRLADRSCGAVIVQRPLAEELQRRFEDFVAGPAADADWPSRDPRDATWDFCALVDFSGLPPHFEGDPLAEGQAFGARLPARGSGREASVRDALRGLCALLPDETEAPGLRKLVLDDFEKILLALREHTSASEYKVGLELIVGDTCQKWHHDHNVLRCIVTYVGPGTMIADETGVSRSKSGVVLDVDKCAEMQLAIGDILMQKGAMWPGRSEGAAHRAPPIGPVGACTQRRLVLKVDVLESNDAASNECPACAH